MLKNNKYEIIAIVCGLIIVLGSVLFIQGFFDSQTLAEGELCWSNCSGKLGDIDGDGLLEASDSTSISEMVAETITPTACGDYNKDCSITSQDADAVLADTITYGEARCITSSNSGDSNTDSIINERDMATILDIVSGILEQPSNICCLDINKDGQITSADSTLVGQIITGARSEDNYCDDLCYYNCSGKLGDIDGDGLLETSDSASISNMASGSQASSACGDYNKDCEITTADATQLSDAIAPYSSATCSDNSYAGDANSDGYITEKDMTTIRAIYDGTVARPSNYCCLDIDSDGLILPQDSTLTGQIITGDKAKEKLCCPHQDKLVKIADSDTIYLIEDCKKRAWPNYFTLNSYGYSQNNAITISDTQILIYPAGIPFADAGAEGCIAGQTNNCGTTDKGACQYGTKTCLSDSSWGQCTGTIEPVDEACDDGIDNDCDGKTDEGCTESEICSDTDGGRNIFTKGTATRGSTSVTDHCYDDSTNRLYEKYCDSNGNTAVETHTCQYGCNDGACNESAQEQTQQEQEQETSSTNDSQAYQALKEKISRLEIKVTDLEKQVVDLEKTLVTQIDQGLTQRLSGRILLQVENNGEAWYVDKDTYKKFYLKDGNTAYSALQAFGLGITNDNLSKIPIGIEERADVLDSDGDGLDDKLEESLGTDINDKDSDDDGHEDGYEVKNGFNPSGPGALAYQSSFANPLKGKILLQVESRGEAWYIHPEDGKRYYMKDGALAYQIMRFLSLGITNDDLRKIDVGEF